MFHSFFPKPMLFFSSFAVWAIFCVILWFTAGNTWGPELSIGNLFGYVYPELIVNGANNEAQHTYLAAQKSALNFWYYQYLVVSFLLFTGFWMRFTSHKWNSWSVAGSSLIVFVTWFQVQIDVMINEWFGRFYNTIQQALSKPNNIENKEFIDHLLYFAVLAAISILFSVLNGFFTSHYAFRWRTAMNEYYMSRWNRLRFIEGVSQRIQEDTMRFATIMESLGTRFLDSVMTLLAFLPILWGLSSHVKVLPLIGTVPQGLVLIAIIWALGGTVLLAAVGIKLPGLQFRNQRVEAAYRKELVMGEDHTNRAMPHTIAQLFNDVRLNYFRLYFHYMYFNITRYSYLQFSVVVPYLALTPTIVTGAITLGIMQQIIRAFGRVESSFQFLVHSWTTIVELISIYKRLAAFEATLQNRELTGIELEVQS
ncbi:MAG: peptide antibiotic transporter SbmA [Hyphomicrobiaceae bacterium]|nr:peptide antibiotic transporter SbmA [Hyphomicrobiaceae bacterium]